MIPIYLSYFTGDGQGGRVRTVRRAAGFFLGFTLAFVLMGALAGTAGAFLRRHRVLVNIISGGAVIAFGLHFLGILKINIFRGIRRQVDMSRSGFVPSFLFGITFSLGWTPCVGAFLGSALMLASQRGHVIEGMLLLLVYSLGLGIPLLLSALLIDYIKTAFDWIRRHYDVINKASGAFLIVVGILMATGLFSALIGSLAAV